MYKLFDFQCSECKKVEEHFIDTNETISIPCTSCTRDKTVTMSRLISAPKGYVKDTINPVRYTK